MTAYSLLSSLFFWLAMLAFMMRAQVKDDVIIFLPLLVAIFFQAASLNENVKKLCEKLEGKR
jgi:hypothetical protein